MTEEAQSVQDRIDALHACVRGRTALLVVDMQRGFLEPGAALEVPGGREALPTVRHLVERCREKGAPVIFTRFIYTRAVPCLRGDPFGVEHLPKEAGQPTGLGRPSSNCLIDADGEDGPNSAAITPELAPTGEELVVDGHTYDKFYGTPLDLALRSHGVECLVVTGVTTDVCVNATILAAAHRNYRVTAVRDAMAAPEGDLHDACLRIWQRKFARIRTADAVLEELSRF